MLNTFVVNCTDLAEFTGIPRTPAARAGYWKAPRSPPFYGPGEEFSS